jgi:hypothetical protein
VTTTNATPESAGQWVKNSWSASSPPAEAPSATMGKRLDAGAGSAAASWFFAGTSAGLLAGGSAPVGAGGCSAVGSPLDSGAGFVG